MIKFNIGDIVVTKPGFTNMANIGNYGGGGYIHSSKPLIVRKYYDSDQAFSSGQRTLGTLYYFEDHVGGIYERSLISIEEIRNKKLEILLKM